jgi:hypothetical protein
MDAGAGVGRCPIYHGAGEATLHTQALGSSVWGRPRAATSRPNVFIHRMTLSSDTVL